MILVSKLEQVRMMALEFGIKKCAHCLLNERIILFICELGSKGSVENSVIQYTAKIV